MVEATSNSSQSATPLLRPVWARLDAVQQRQRGALMPWSAVTMGLGVGLYFNLSHEPTAAFYAVVAALMALSVGAALRFREHFGPLAWALALIAAGFLLAGLRTHAVAAPVLDYRYYGAIEGQVVAVDRSASDAVRVTLSEVRLEDMPPDRTPERVRLSLHGAQTGTAPQPGAWMMVTGHLTPPSGPAEPGGFDFQRHAWFQGLGAVGYSRTPLVLLEPRAPGDAWLFHLRMAMSAHIRSAIEGQPGAFAAAVLTGDRSGLSQASTQAMRDSNIAHLLAISGLHMGLLTGFIFAATRMLLAWIPALALRYPIKKWAALVALIAGAFYLALSGASVATERAYIQVAVMFTAVLLDRRAITLRSVAIAAIILLIHRPETLMSPGFQMSFAATAALVGVFSALSKAQAMSGWPKWARGLAALVVSSAVAGAATAPFAAAHFNQIAVYGLAANLLSVPVMGSVVIPLAVVAALVAPLGLSGPVFFVMELGLRWILAVAERVSNMPGAVSPIAAPPEGLLALLTFGGLFVLIWSGRERVLGFAPVVAALLLWTSGDRPHVLISQTGRLVGVLGEEGRALSRARGDGFVADIWLENDGDRADQAEAAARVGWVADGYGYRAEVLGVWVWHGSGRRAFAEAPEACQRHDLVIVSERADDALASNLWGDLAGDREAPGRWSDLAGRSDGCRVVDAAILEASGALAVTEEGVILSARAAQGHRPWTRQ